MTNKNSHPEILQSIQTELQWSADQNVQTLSSFFHTDTHLPLITCGMGGGKPAAHYMALLYGAQSAMAQALTCYQVNALSDTTLSNSKVLIHSAAGRNDDVHFVANRLKRLGHSHAASFTLFDSEKNRVRPIISALPHSHSFNLNGNSLGAFGNKHTFVDINPVVSEFALIYKAFTGRTDFTSLDFNRTYTYTTNAGANTVPDLSQIEHFVVLYGHYGQPVAVDIDSKLVESGFASVQYTDYRDFVHGRFSFIGNHMDQGRTAIIMLLSPREQDIVNHYRMIKSDPRYKSDQPLPDDVPVITLTTEYDSPLASVDLLLQWTKLYLDISSSRGIKDPYNPPCPHIDKRVPMGAIRFISDLKTRGPLKLAS